MSLLRRILNFFVKDAIERMKFTSTFNKRASEAFQLQYIDTFVEASTCYGSDDSSFRHEFSAPLPFCGFLIKTSAGKETTEDEVMALGKLILADQSLVRRMYVLHWDTLYIKDPRTGYSLHWRIKDFLQYGGQLTGQTLHFLS